MKASLTGALHQGSHIDRSANVLLLPLEGLEEVLEALEAFKVEPKLAMQAVLPAIYRATRAMENSVVSSDVKTLCTDFLLHSKALNPTNDRTKTKVTPGDFKHSYLSSNRKSIASATTLAISALQSTGGYQDLLFAHLRRLLKVNIATSDQCSKLNDTCLELAAHGLAGGRTAHRLSSEISILPSKTGKFVDRLESIISAEGYDFTVAIVVDNTNRVSRKNDGVFKSIRFPVDLIGGESPLSHGDSSIRVNPLAHADLVQFCLHHWQLPPSPDVSERPIAGALILTTRVRAHDAEQARNVALDLAEGLIDEMNVEHRTAHFGVKRKALVWKTGNRRAEVISTPSTFVRETRTIRNKSPFVDRSLRFASRASGERSGAMKTFFSWISLEYLGHGESQSPQNVVASEVPRLISLVCADQIVIDAYYEMDRQPGGLPIRVSQLISRNGVNTDKTFDRSKLVALLIGDTAHLDRIQKALGVDSAEALLSYRDWRDYLNTLPGYSRWRMSRARDLLREPLKLQAFIKSVQDECDVVLQRMRFVRNQTAHSGDFDSVRHLPLAAASGLVLDSVYRVVPRWNSEPAACLKDVSSRQRTLISSLGDASLWQGAKHAQKFDDSILRP